MYGFGLQSAPGIDANEHDMSDFDQRAKEWDNDPAKVRRAEAVADGIRRRVKLTPAMSALEYGAGTGLLGFMLADELGPMTLADISEGMLAVAREKIAASGREQIEALRLDLCADPLPARRYDLVFSLMTLHHVPDTDAALRALRAVLAPGGRLCIADLDAEDGSFHGAGVDLHHGFEREDLARRARAAGFESVAFDTVFEVHKPVDGNPRRYPVFLMTAA